MLIGIDGNEANTENRVGSNVYAYEILKKFHRFKRDRQFRIYLKKKPLDDMPRESSAWQYCLVKPRRLTTQVGLPWALFQQRPRPEVFFSPGHYLPRCSPCPCLMTILDTAYLEYPAMFRKRDLWQLKRWTAVSIKKAARILTISENSKNAIINHYHLSPAKVKVIYLGLKMKPKPKKADLKKYGVRSEYILYVGTLQPRKNLEKLIEALPFLEDKKLKLVIVGKKGWLYDRIFAKVQEMDLKKRVIFTGFVPDEDLPAFYRQAQCLVLVSLYEGFGLPVLEAMDHGCPVVASNVSSLPELVGQAGVLVDPQAPEKIAAGIEKAMKNKDALVKKGKAQVKKFSWEKCARETLEALEEVARK